ncbi:MAG: SPOR domain-containing protein [Fidelibacterota bacterium]|tara:strand:+ start:248 stop:661 length:414 start_codon:yes stop_codon:yes gene_type:complete
MRLLIILFITSFIYGQSDFILPSDFADNPPNLPNVILPSFDDSGDSETVNDIDFTNSVKGYRIQVMISEDEKDLMDVKEKLELIIKEKIYIKFELPNYKLRVGNFDSRKKAETYRNKVIQLGYRSAWVVPTLIELDY